MNTSILQYKVFCKITLTNKQKFISFSQNQCWNQFEHWLCLKGLIGNLGKLHHVNACALIEQFHQLGCDCCPFIYLLSLQLPFCKGMVFVSLEGGTLSSFYALLCITNFMRQASDSRGQEKQVSSNHWSVLFKLQCQDAEILWGVSNFAQLVLLHCFSVWINQNKVTTKKINK